MINLPVENMSAEEKVGVMETLWDDLCKQNSEISSPQWHGDLLTDREQWVSEHGEDAFEEWGDAKRDIDRQLS